MQMILLGHAIAALILEALCSQVPAWLRITCLNPHFCKRALVLDGGRSRGRVMGSTDVSQECFPSAIQIEAIQPGMKRKC